MQTDREFGQVSGFAPGPNFNIQPFVLVALRAGDVSAIEPVADIGVAKAGFHPVEGLQKNIAARVGLDMTHVKRKVAAVVHARAGRL